MDGGPMTRILQIIADGNPGGGTTHVLQILTSLKKTYDISLLTQSNSFLFTKALNLSIPCLPVNFFTSRFDLRVPLQLRRLIRQVSPDLVHVHGIRAGFYYSLAKIKYPTIYTSHGYFFQHKPILIKLLLIRSERMISKIARHVIFVAKSDVQIALKHRLLPKGKKYSVLYCGIAIEQIQQSMENPQKYIGFIGRLVQIKDPILFVDIMKLLPGFRAMIVGGGDLENKVNKKIQDNHLSNIEMLGTLSHDDVIKILGKLSALIITSHWEGLPIIAVEAMGSGVPVISANVGGIGEIIEDGVNGFLIDSRSPGNFAEAITKIENDQQLREHFIKNARQRVFDQFTEQQMIFNLRNLYEDTIKA